MLKYFLLSFTLLFVNTLFAKVLIDPVEAMKATYGQESSISKGKFHLTNEKFKKIQAKTKTKLNTKNYVIYRAKKDDKVLGYGILINKKVRSKNGVVLYLIANGKLQGIEIIAFNEPQEYIPNKEWQANFKDKNATKMLQLSQDIPTITGATLSAKSVVDGSRIAFALYDEVIKGN